MADPEREGKRVLVIEDDADFGPMLARCLQALPAEVHHQECADEAIAALNEHQYDLVVVDTWLPNKRTDLDEKRKLEREYDILTEKLMKADANETGKEGLRESMEKIITLARATLDRRGGLSVLEASASYAWQDTAVLILTALGNGEIRQDAEEVIRRIGCSRFEYLVKPQSPEAILAYARDLLAKK